MQLTDNSRAFIVLEMSIKIAQLKGMEETYILKSSVTGQS